MTNEEAQEFFTRSVGDADEQPQWQLDVIKDAFQSGYDRGYTQANLDAVDKGEMKW